MWTKLLHHASVLNEVWIEQEESWSNHKTHFQSGWIEMAEKIRNLDEQKKGWKILKNKFQFIWESSYN